MRRVGSAWLVGLGFWLAASITLRAADNELYGALYRPLTDVAAQYHMSVSWTAPQTPLQLQNQYSTLEFTVNERSLRLNGQPMALGAPIVADHGTFYVSKRDFDNNLVPLLSPCTLPNPPALHRIIIDPGHGGVDPGTSNLALHMNEKTNTLDVALRLAPILRQRGYEVVLTRTADVSFERKLRPLFANKAKGDLYISIHFNQVDDPAVSGVETWILAPPWQPSSKESALTDADKLVLPGNRFDFWNTILGFTVEHVVTSELHADDRGVKRARYDVLTPLDMPGMLIECGFLSSSTEAVKIGSPAYRQKIAESIADGIDLYKTTLDRLRPAPLVPPTIPPAPGKN
jgi:N-acetylmuramoyl-L-alanine amidase